MQVVKFVILKCGDFEFGFTCKTILVGDKKRKVHVLLVETDILFQQELLPYKILIRLNMLRVN